MKRARFFLTIPILTALSILGVASCSQINNIGPNCDRSAEKNPPIRYTEGKVESGVYMSSPWAGELLWFPAGMRYELPHGLGEVPRFVDLWLSFDHCGTKSSTVAPAAGNQAELREIDKDKLVVVNGSCVDYWLLVIAGTGDGKPNPPEETDSGTSDEPDGACRD